MMKENIRVEDFILVCEYGCNGSDPEIVLYKRKSNSLGGKGELAH